MKGSQEKRPGWSTLSSGKALAVFQKRLEGRGAQAREKTEKTSLQHAVHFDASQKWSKKNRVSCDFIRGE